MSKGTVAAKALTDGKRIRWTLEEQQRESQQLVRIDWCRFTLPLDGVIERETVKDAPGEFLAALDRSGRDLVRMCRFEPGAQDHVGALWIVGEVARRVVALSGGVFEAGTPEASGMDYYTVRCPLVVEGATVGFVLAGGRQEAQAGTVHVNVFGLGCLYLAPRNWSRIREFIAQARGWITRADMAVDIWSGFDIEQMHARYVAGEFDVRGQRPKESLVGGWWTGDSRTVNVGKRDTGKVCRVYEKGDQLFGPEVGDEWVRVEVEVRNNARVIDLDVLTRPADFFAGAYPFCQNVLDALEVVSHAQRIPAGQRVQDKTAEAAVMGLAKSARNVMAPTLCWLLTMGGDILDHIATTESWRLPVRLRGFSPQALRSAVEKVAGAFAPAPVHSINGAA